MLQIQDERDRQTQYEQVSNVPSQIFPHPNEDEFENKITENIRKSREVSKYVAHLNENARLQEVKAAALQERAQQKEKARQEQARRLEKEQRREEKRAKWMERTLLS